MKQYKILENRQERSFNWGKMSIIAVGERGRGRYESPVVTTDNFYNGEKVLVIHNFINDKGKMILNKEEAALLFVELYKFIKS